MSEPDGDLVRAILEHSECYDDAVHYGCTCGWEPTDAAAAAPTHTRANAEWAAHLAAQLAAGAARALREFGDLTVNPAHGGLDRYTLAQVRMEARHCADDRNGRATA